MIIPGVPLTVALCHSGRSRVEVAKERVYSQSCLWEPVNKWLLFKSWALFKNSSVPWEKGEKVGRGNMWTRLEAESGKEKKAAKSNFLWKHIVLLGSPGSIPKAQLKVNFFYWIPPRDIITSKDYYYPEGFRWNHLCVTLEMQGVTIVIWQHGPVSPVPFCVGVLLTESGPSSLQRHPASLFLRLFFT